MSPSSSGSSAPAVKNHPAINLRGVHQCKDINNILHTYYGISICIYWFLFSFGSHVLMIRLLGWPVKFASADLRSECGSEKQQ